MDLLQRYNMLCEAIRATGRAAPARLDPDGTEKPRTRIVHHPRAGQRVGPGMELQGAVELEQEGGSRISIR